MEVLVIADLHCREFWKDAVKDWNGPIIFLGDYVDPYPYEWEDKEQMPNPVDCLLDVINFKDCNPDRVILLIGNHDESYIHEGLNASRHNYSLHDTLHQIYNEDKEYFQIAKQIDDTLFTHAGVSTAWLKRHDLTLPKTDADVFLNEIYKTSPDIFWEMSWERGGWCSTGSPIWHDVREFDIEPDFFEVFGHTQLKDNPFKRDNWICCDCRRPFIFDTITHEIKEFNYGN